MIGRKVLIFSTLFWLMVGCAPLLDAKALSLRACQRQFSHSGAGAAVSLETVGNTDLLHFRARFTADGSERACWDLPCHLDLSKCAGVKLRIRYLNTHLTSQLCIYLQTSGGWQRAVVTPRSTGCWEDIIIPKSAFLPETSANASWNACSRLRLDAWRASPGVFSFHLASLELLPANASIALLRSGLHENLDDAKRREALRHSQRLGEALAAGGVYPAVIDEPDATATALRGYQCVLLPAAEQTSSATTQQLCTYLRQGGKIAAFYALPAKLADAMALPQGKFIRAATLPKPLAQVVTNGGASFRQNSTALMAVAAKPSEHLRIRAWWVDSSDQRTQWPAILQSPQGLWMTHVYLNQDPDRGTPVLLALLEDLVPDLRETAGGALCREGAFALANADRKVPHNGARRALAQARAAHARHDYIATHAAIRRLFSELADERTPTLTQWNEEATRATETRGAWMLSATGLPGQNWGATLRQLAEAHFNTVLPRFLTPYGVAWPSAHAARLPGVPKRGDLVAECLAAAKNHHLKVHAWACLLSVEDAPAELQKKFRESDLLQRNYQGDQVLWLCPSRKYTHDLLAQLVRELARNYALDGLQLDMLRYQGSETCYCDTCKELFTRHINRRLTNWPACTRDPLTLQKQWEEFRCKQLTQLLQELVAAAKAARPGLRISAAVYPELGAARRNVGQDWPQWLSKGLVEFVAPMNYQATTNQFQAYLTQQCETLGLKAAEQLLPGIGVTVKNLGLDEARRQVQATRNASLNGFILFEYNAQSAQGIVPFLMK